MWGELHAPRQLHMCMLLQSREPRRYRTRLPRTRTVPRFRSRESFSLGLPTCPRFSSRGCGRFLYAHYRIPVIVIRRAIDIVCWCCAVWPVAGCALISMLIFHICRRAAFLLWILGHVLLHYLLHSTLAPGPLCLHAVRGSTLDSRECRELEREHSHHPTRNRTGSCVHSIRPRPPRCAEDCGGWTLHALSRSRRRSRRSCHHDP